MMVQLMGLSARRGPQSLKKGSCFRLPSLFKDSRACSRAQHTRKYLLPTRCLSQLTTREAESLDMGGCLFDVRRLRGSAITSGLVWMDSIVSQSFRAWRIYFFHLSGLRCDACRGKLQSSSREDKSLFFTGSVLEDSRALREVVFLVSRCLAMSRLTFRK